MERYLERPTSTVLTADGELRQDGTPFFKTPYNHDTVAEAKRSELICHDPTLAQQHSKDETDINVIVDRFLKTGALPNVPVPPTYENFGDIFDFQSALNTVKAAQDSFMALPANIRARFQNDPARFVGYVDHCYEMDDLEPLREMGLVITKKPPEPEKAQVPPPPPKEGEPGKGPPSGPKT